MSGDEHKPSSSTQVFLSLEMKQFTKGGDDIEVVNMRGKIKSSGGVG